MADNRTKVRRFRFRMGERRIILLFGDLLISYIALFVGLYVWQTAQDIPTFAEFLRVRPEPWVFLLPIAWVMLLFDTYDNRTSSRRKVVFPKIMLAGAIAGVAYLLIYFTSEQGSLPRRGIAVFLVLAIIFTWMWRLFFIRIFTSPQYMRRVLVVGAGVTGQALLKEYMKLSPPPYHVIGFLDDDPDLQSKKVYDYSVVGDSRRLLEIVDEENITDIIVAISGKIKPRMFRMILDAQEQGVEITRFPTAFEALTGRIPVQYLEADWMIRSFVDENTPNSFYEFTKRIMDIIGGFIGSVLFMFIIVPIVSLATMIDSGWPIFFSQTRVGKGGKDYTIFKFRTMVLNAEKDGNPILAQEKDDRVTRWGRFMRKVRLDETPQFLNVLKGDMSLVGPRPERPELMEHFQKHIPFYRARVLDKPGITGWAQVNFDYAATLDEMVTKLEYDLYYIKHRSLRLDLIILLRTIGTVIGFRGR